MQTTVAKISEAAYRIQNTKCTSLSSEAGRLDGLSIRDRIGEDKRRRPCDHRWTTGKALNTEDEKKMTR